MSGSSGFWTTSWDLACSLRDLVLPAPLGMVLKPLQGARCPPACSGPVQLLLSDRKTEAQNNSVLPTPKSHRVRTVLSFRFPTSGAQLPYLPKNRPWVGVEGYSGMVLQRLQDTVISSGQAFGWHTEMMQGWKAQ